MEDAVLIRATGLSKTYPQGTNPLARMKNLLLARADADVIGFQALRDVSLSLVRGEALGVIGRNGAGKSTLLQLLCGTQSPTQGTVERFGRIAAMLELGAGFNPEFTGRENVHLNASLYGLSDADVASRFGSIAAFADIGAFIDRPVREYSSGMHARLAFAICAHVDADVLVVDEVLGVGDHAFQAKCRTFIEEFLKRGAVIFVSHDELSVLTVCERAIWLEGGALMAEGSSQDVLRRYRQAMEVDTDGAALMPVAKPAPDAAAPVQGGGPGYRDARAGTNPVAVSPFLSRSPSHGHGGAVIEDVYLAAPGGSRQAFVQGGDPVALHIRGRAIEPVARPIVGFIFRDALGQNLFGDNTYLAYRTDPRANGGRRSVPCGAGVPTPLPAARHLHHRAVHHRRHTAEPCATVLDRGGAHAHGRRIPDPHRQGRCADADTQSGPGPMSEPRRLLVAVRYCRYGPPTFCAATVNFSPHGFRTYQ